MEISCSLGGGAEFDRALALLHNIWYRRALEGFQQSQTLIRSVQSPLGRSHDIQPSLLGRASSADETAAWGLVQKGLAAKKVLRARSSMSTRSPLYSKMLAQNRKPCGTKAT